jgi:hypothetical protein
MASVVISSGIVRYHSSHDPQYPMGESSAHTTFKESIATMGDFSDAFRALYVAAALLCILVAVISCSIGHWLL